MTQSGIRTQRTDGADDEQREQAYVASDHQQRAAPVTASVSMALDMAAAYRIILARPIQGLDNTLHGESLAQETADLDWIAKECGVRRLSEFCQPMMFPPDEGLRVVQFYCREIAAYPDSANRYGPLLCDLKDCERILGLAFQHDVPWHFSLEEHTST